MHALGRRRGRSDGGVRREPGAHAAIEAALGDTTITVEDRVENRGFRPTPHMLLYHYNFGYPLLDEGAELLVPSRAIVHACTATCTPTSASVQAAGEADFSEQVYQHDVVAGPDGMASALLINPALGAAASASGSTTTGRRCLA